MGIAASCLLGPGAGQILMKSAASGNVEHVREILELKPTLVAHNQMMRRDSCLHAAAAQGHLRVLEAIVEALRPRPSNSNPGRDHPELANQLPGSTQLPAGPLAGICDDPIRKLMDKCNRQGLTPLMLASAAGYDKCVVFLLSQGANPLVRDGQHRSALHHAVENGKAQIVRLLLDSDMEMQMLDGIHVLKNVQLDDASGPARYMDGKTIYGSTPLHIAAGRQDIACVRALLEAGADMMVCSTGEGQLAPKGMGPVPMGSTALHLASAASNISIIQALLQANANAMEFWGGARQARQEWEGDQRLDLRCIPNATGRMPWRLASRQPIDYAAVLDPMRAIHGALADIGTMQGALGPPSLQAIAAWSVRSVLLDWLYNFEDSVETAAIRHERDTKSGMHKGSTRSIVVAAHQGFSRTTSLQPHASVSSPHSNAYSPSGGSGELATAPRELPAANRGRDAMMPVRAISLSLDHLLRDSPSAPAVCPPPAIRRSMSGADDLSTCGICLCKQVDIAMVGCHHRMCAGCGITLCRYQKRPPLCPFCRTMISGFMACPS